MLYSFKIYINMYMYIQPKESLLLTLTEGHRPPARAEGSDTNLNI